MSVLDTPLAPSPSPASAQPRPTALVITNAVPGHDLGFQKSGHGQYLGSILEQLAERGFSVTLFVLRPSVDFVWRARRGTTFTVSGPSFRTLWGGDALCDPVAIARLGAWQAFVRLPRWVQRAVDTGRMIVRRRRGFSHSLGRFPTAGEAASVRACIAQMRPDIVLYDGVFNCDGMSPADGHWVITHEVKHLRAAAFRGEGVTTLPAGFDECTERRILQSCSNIVAIHWDDARELARLAPASRVVVVPVTMALPDRLVRDERVPRRCLFVGSGSFHNLHGLQWFLSECWPRIRARVPDATLDVVGSVCFRLSDVPAGVTCHGTVDDLARRYAAAAVTIVPLRIGSGLKVKLVEALAYEQAIVTTSVGAQGVAEIAAGSFVVADSAEAFVDASVLLLNSADRRAELRAAAARSARLFDKRTAFEAFDAALTPQRCRA